MSGYQQVFGGNTLYPSQVAYLSLALTQDTVLQWPLEASTGSNLVARIIDVTPSSAGLSIFMPAADETAPGQTTMFFNAGASTFTVKDTSGNTLLSVASGLTWALYLRDNTIPNGLWRTFQYGASTAQAQASALAGLGLIAQGSLLAQSQPVVTFTMSYTAGASDRASAYVWEGGLGTLSLAAASVLGNNWFMSIRNAGIGNLTIAPGGVDTINGATTLELRPGDSATINTDGTSFWTVGLGQNPVFAFDYTSIDLTGLSGTYTLSGSELNRIAYDFVGVLAGNIEVIVPATTQQYWVANDTTGGSFTLTLGTATQASPVNVVRGGRGIYYCQGSVVVNADTASIASPIGIGDGGTGATTASGARINLGGTTIGIGVFTAASAAAGRTALLAAASGANSDITSLSGLTTPLAPAEGGTGLTSFTPGTDYVAPATPTNFTAKQTFTGALSNTAARFVNAVEAATRIASAATGTVNFDYTSQSILWYTTNATGNWTLNIRGNSGNTLNSLLANDETATLTFLASQGSPAFFLNAIQIDGTTSGVTTKWIGGAPIAGGVNALDLYSVVVWKTATSTFSVVASLASAT